MPLDVLGRTRATLINPTSTTKITNPRVVGFLALHGVRGLAIRAPGPIGLGNL